ncbi:hypothetical protein [Halalkalicoccus subterraneus]|uniref:hypothetical protein n=1 Tax=Halalkalicoccus subterraneus TaxID=2675002 RepID=UPI000EFBEC05|nr:hypothetical protein [Halalkalicoccus subterraneus]
MVRALAVEADLEITVEGHSISVSGSGKHLTIGVDSIRGSITVLRSFGTVSELIELLGTRFVGADLSAAIDVDGITVARIGPHTEPNALSRVLGISPASVWPGPIARVVLHEFGV